MLEKLLEQKKEQIDSRAENDKKATEYIVNLIEENWDEYKTIFCGEHVAEKDLANHLYRSVTHLIKELTNYHTRPFGIRTARCLKGEEPQTPEVRLGWASYKVDSCQLEPHQNGYLAHSYHLFVSEKGIKIIDGYRKAKGLIPLDERKDKDKEAMFGGIK